jgi:hypothetical protein
LNQQRYPFLMTARGLWFAAAGGAMLFVPGVVSAAQYPYPAEPQYQYPRMDGRPDLKCPKGKKPFQGKCRPVRRVD